MMRERRSTTPSLSAGTGIKEGVIIIPRGPRSPHPVSPLAPTNPRPSPTLPQTRLGRAPTQRRRIYCVDVGSTRQDSFAWTRVDPAESDPVPAGNYSIESLCRRLVDDLQESRSVALGFEAPLFLPVPTCVDDLSGGRDNEGNRSCFSPQGGAYVATLGLHQAAWILKYVAAQLPNSVRVTVDPHAWPPQGDPVLFCWEAFVSGGAKGKAAGKRRASPRRCDRDDGVSQT